MNNIDCNTVHEALSRWLRRLKSKGNMQQAIKFIYTEEQMYIDPTGIVVYGKSNIDQTDIGCDILIDTIRVALDNLTLISQFLIYCNDNKEQDYLVLLKSWKNYVKCL